MTATREVLAPGDGSSVGSVAETPADEVPELVSRARAAQPGWRRAAPHARAAVLRRAADVLRTRSDELGHLHARESGKVITQARGEILGSADLLDANAHVGRFDTGDLAPTGAVPRSDRDVTFVERVPLGVVVCVIPFNFPVELTVEKAAAALVAGNTVILKPPPQNPLATMEAASVIIEAGLPANVLQVAPGGTELSAALCASPGVDAVSLTGSVGAGVAVARATAEMLRPLHLELGGNGAMIVLDDADLEHAADEAIKGRLLMNGQACAATKRIIASDRIADDLAALLEARLGGVRVGDPTNEDSQVGPLIDERSASHVADQVRRAVADGGSLVSGRLENDRAWFAPVLLAGVPGTAAVASDDEIFGPVFPVIPVTDADEAIGVANSSKLGLTAAVFSADVSRAVAVADELDVGGVVINGTNNYRPPVVPFGGVGLAGAGREGIGYTYEEMTRTKFIALRNLRPERDPVVPS